MEQEPLISAVQKRPALYDKTVKNYITTELEKIAEEVGCNVDASSQDDQPRVNAPHTRPQTKRSVRRPPYPQERHDIHLDVEMIQTLKGLSQKQEDTNNDEDLIFFKSLLPKMKLLNPDEGVSI
ncbi:hypothetical protein RRG08_047056 [Elysia crispata]|uniref:BESS domain-containing protein n=1 Tax=Elysia crispata TaxID=231223 RepID=A0AAE1E271_9GAST|nr:hypothetical protein RRG08_047056 [Elysia crispata]